MLTQPDPESAARAKELLTPFRDAGGQIAISQRWADYLEMLIAEAIHDAMRGTPMAVRQPVPEVPPA